MPLPVLRNTQRMEKTTSCAELDRRWDLWLLFERLRTKNERDDLFKGCQACPMGVHVWRANIAGVSVYSLGNAME